MPAMVTVAQAALTKSVAAGIKAGSFHYVELSTNDGTPEAITGFAGPTNGRQTITQRGASGINVFNERLVDGVVYFRGNRAAVIDQLGVPTARATTAANRWVRLVKGYALYQTFADGITAKSNLSQLPTTFAPRTVEAVSGTSTTRISGGLKEGKNHAAIGTAVLVVATSSSLPKSFAAQAVGTNDARLRLSWTFNQWHHPVQVVVPSGAVPYSSLGATPPSSGG